MDIVSFIECSNQTRSVSTLFELLVNCATQGVFGETVYGALTCTERGHLPNRKSPAVATNFPAKWCGRYLERKYCDIDPVVRRAPVFSRPFVWDQLAQRCQLQERGHLVLAESLGAGLKHRISVPSERVSVMSFASRFDDVESSLSNEPSSGRSQLDEGWVATATITPNIAGVGRLCAHGTFRGACEQDAQC